MARKTFISYKYDEARALRDRIIEALGDDATYYQGETSDSPDLTDRTTETIKEHLKDMIYGTSVTIVIISPKMLQSNWIEWEVSYSLKECKRGDHCSHANGIVGVVMNNWSGGTNWLTTHHTNKDGCTSVSHDSTKLLDIINSNRFNQKPLKYVCDQCKTVDALNGSYIALIDEDDFLANPTKYIENAFEKSTRTGDYTLHKK